MRFPPDVSTVGDCVVLGLEISQLCRRSQARITAGYVFKFRAWLTVLDTRGGGRQRGSDSVSFQRVKIRLRNEDRVRETREECCVCSVSSAIQYVMLSLTV